MLGKASSSFPSLPREAVHCKLGASVTCKTITTAISGHSPWDFKRIHLKKLTASWVLVAHTCNPIYSGGRDQEDCGLKAALANSSQDSISKNLSQKRAGGVAQDVSP
jgi:hypothetical protein